MAGESPARYQYLSSWVLCASLQALQVGMVLRAVGERSVAGWALSEVFALLGAAPPDERGTLRYASPAHPRPIQYKQQHHTLRMTHLCQNVCT